MEKSNELNKFLSYIHMGMSIYRIYSEHAEKLAVSSLIKLLNEVETVFKRHETEITNLIDELDEKATESLTFAGIMGVYKEKLKNFDSAYTICINAIKTTNMGLISALNFLDENTSLPDNVKLKIKAIINDYINIEVKITNYLLEQL